MKRIKHTLLNIIQDLFFYSRLFFKNYFDFSGRTRPKAFLYYTIFSLIMIMISDINDTLCSIVTFFLLFLFIPLWAQEFRRLHDAGYFGGWYIVYYIILMSAFVAWGVYAYLKYHIELTDIGNFSYLYTFTLFLADIVIFFLPSEENENKYGFSPIKLEKIYKNLGTLAKEIKQEDKDRFAEELKYIQRLRREFLELHSSMSRPVRMKKLQDIFDIVRILQNHFAQKETVRDYAILFAEMREDIKNLPSLNLGAGIFE